MGIVARVRTFTTEVVAEFRRVIWPTRQDVLNSTMVVIVVTVVLAFFLGAVDVGLTKVMEKVLR